MSDKNPAAVKPDQQEIASIARDVLRLTFNGILENLDDTLQTRGRAKGLKIYDELERDAHCFCVLQKRKLAVTARPWDVEAASDAAVDKNAADMVKRQLKALSFDKLTTNLLDATLKGYSVGEVMWTVRDNEIAVDRILPRDQRRFLFDDNFQLRLLTRENLMAGELMPDRKFLVHSVGAKDGSPYGLGLGSKLFWPVFFKKQDISFWLTFADKFGSPTSVGKYPASAKKAEQDKLLAVLRAISQEAGIIIPQGMEVEFLEAARSGSVDCYERLARYMDEQMSECVLGESITTTPKATGLGSGVASAQNEVRKEISKADGDMLSDTLNATLVRWIVDFNMPGAAYPRVYRDFEDPEDLERRSTVDKNLHEMGYEPESVEYINETYGGKWRKVDKPAPAKFMPPNQGAQFAEGALRDVADDYAERLDANARASIDALIAPVRTLVMSAPSLTAIRDGLIDLYPDLDATSFAAVLEEALTAADLAGRYEVINGA